MATSVLRRSYYNHSSLSDNMARDARDSNRSFKTYTIPRKERRPSEDCQFTLPVDSREAKEIENAVRRLTWDTNNLDKAVSISHIKKVDNPGLEREYHEKRAALREEGRSPKELTEQLAFGVETEDGRAKEICRLGLECDGGNRTLGDGDMGVTVWKCPDLCLRALNWPVSGAAYLVVYKIVKGRVKSVTPETPNLEPTPNYDCHMSRNVASSSVTDLSTLMRSTQYYLYEYDDEGLPSKRPRHCLPFAVIHLKRNENTTGVTKPQLPLEKPASPVKESSKATADTKTPCFSDDDGILAWRGLVTSNEKSLGFVSLLAGHKLCLNFWKSYLDVSKKIILKQLSLMLPGDVKSAWKSPLLYRTHVLSLCSMKPAPGQPSEKFTNFTRHLAIKAKAAGVLCVDSFTTLFLVPSSKLAIRLGFCTAEKPPRMFCIVCRRHSTLLSPISAWPQASPVTSPAGSRSAPATHTGIPAETVAAAVRPASLDLEAQHKGKIVVSSLENNIPKRTHPRQIAKRSLSFPFSPVTNAKNRLPRISRSASTSERDCSRGENNVGSEFRPHRPDRFLEFQTNCNVSLRAPEFEQHSCPRSQLKFSTSTQNVSKKFITMKESQLTPSVKEACHEESSCTKVKHATSVAAGRKYLDVSLNSTSLTKLESSVTSLAACTISSPCSGGLSPFWPNSPIVLSSGSDKNPFVYDTPLERDERTESKRRLSVSPGDNWPFNLPQSRDELSEKQTKQLTRRDEDADSTPRMILGSPFHALEEKPPRGTSLHLENWNTASSFLSDKQALRSLRKAAAFQRGPSKLHNSTESHNDLQTLNLKMSEPSNIVSSNLSNMGGDDSLDKEAIRTKLPQVQDDLQCVDMEISESPECPIILSRAFSCAPSELVHDSSSSLSTNPVHLASGMTPFAGSATSGSSVDKHARHSMEISWPSNAANISELPLPDSGNSWKEDIKNSLQHDDVGDELSSAPNAGAFVMDSTLSNVDMFPKASESREVVDPIDMDIVDDVELLSNTLEFEADGTARPVPTKMAEVLGDYNANSSEETFSSSKVGTGGYLTKNNVTGTSEDRIADVSDKATSGITTDHFNTKVPNEKRSYSHLTSSPEQDIDGGVLDHLEKENPSTCSLTNRKPVVFSLSPKKSTKIIARQLKTLQNAFTAETNCDQPSLCSSDDVRSTKPASVKSSPRKSTTDQSSDCIGRINSNELETMGETRDPTPLAVSCTAFERDDTDFPEHAGPHLGGVIETSLFQDWGVTEDSLISADYDGSTEVYDLGSQADQTLEPIETWPVIDDGGFPDPEIVACSPLNSIETFTLRFPGESGFDEDEDEVNPRETKITEGEAILVEERCLGFFMGPEVVICSDGTSETIMTSSEEFDSGAFFPSNDNDEANLETKGFQCEDSKTTDEMPSVGSVCTSPAEGLSEKLGFEDDFKTSERLSPVAKQCIQTEHSTEGCSESVSQSLPSRSSNTGKYKHLIQSEEMVVSRKEEPVKGGVALPDVQETGYPCAEKLNTTPSNSMIIRSSYSEKRGVETETSPGNEAEQRLREANCPSKWPCSKEVKTGSRLAKNMTDRGEKLNLLRSSEFPTVVQGKTQSDNAFERGQELIFPNDLRDTQVDPQQEKKIPSCEELITLPKTCITDNVKVKPSSGNKHFTTALNEGGTSTTLSYPSPTLSSSKPQSSGINKATDFETKKNLPRKPVESSAEVATNGKPVAEIIGTVHLPRVTVTMSHLSNKPETGSQGGKTKESHRDSSERDCQGKIEPLRNINDLQRDNRILNGKRKLVIEPEDIAKHRRLSTAPPPAPEKSREVDFGGISLYRHYTERRQPEYGLAEYGRRYSSPHNMAPYLPTHLPVRSLERGGLPRVFPNDPHWYPPIGVTSQHRFEGIYPSSADCGRAIFAPIMYRARPMFSPPGTVPDPWQLPGYPCHVTYPLLGRR